MKQYTSKDQTAKLIELGFPKPTDIMVDVFPTKEMSQYVSYKNDLGYIVCRANYSIGELIEFLCPHFQSTNYRLELQKIQELSWDIEVRDVNDNSLDYQVKEELIDALFCACVTLKEEGVI